MQPTSIGDWTIKSKLGEGFFASVYLAEKLGVSAALKISKSMEPDALERMEIEKSALRRLSDSSIPELIDQGRLPNKTPYLVTSVAPGVTLSSIIDENLKQGRLFGDIEACHVLLSLLTSLAYVHSQGLVHRDVKDANVLVDESQVTLIDFGFCKEAGEHRLRSSESFWRAGAARFSPPSKLSNPGRADPSHDVFAVGVIAYRMLTGEFPWSVTRYDDVFALRDLQRSLPLLPVKEVNSYVWPPISDYVNRLLSLDDARRPTALDSVEALQGLIRRYASGDVRRRRAVATIRYPWILRDPIHKDVRLTDFEFRVLNTPQMQRLRRIRQLGLTNLVYPGAEHSRLSHSIGSVARVEQIFRAIEDQDGTRLDSGLRLASRLYALVHDVTHIPFGHTIEDELGFFSRHDENQPRAERILASAEGEMADVLVETDYGRVVLDSLRRANDKSPVDVPLWEELVSSPIGADVLDYVDRDAHFCGLEHGIDTAIFRQFRLHADLGRDTRRFVSYVGGEYGLRADREFAAEVILKERYALFLKVYTHRAKAAASGLLSKALYTAIYDTKGIKQLRQERIEQMGDESVLDFLQSSPKAIVSEYAKQLRNRVLPPAVYRGVMLGPNNLDESSYATKREWLKSLHLDAPAGRHELEARLAKEARLEPSQVIVYCPPKAPGFKLVKYWQKESEDEEPVVSDQTGNDLTRKHLALWELWVFGVGLQGDDRARTKLADEAQSLFGLQNMIHVHPRAGRLF